MPALSSARLAALLTVTLLAPPAVFGAPCVVPANGTGTADMPPTCTDGYKGIMQISNGLPSNATIDIDASWRGFFGLSEGPGGSLGGDIQTFSGVIEMQMTGTGVLAGFSRFITVPVSNETHSAPRIPGSPVQSFAGDVVSISGDLFGDPDFDILRVRAGTSHGLPSPGHTILTEQGSNYNVDSFFDIAYTIEFQGAPGGALDGHSGTTQRTDEFRAGVAVPPGTTCLEPDNGFGTVDLPPLCPPGYDGHMSIRGGLPGGTSIEMDATLGAFFNRVEVAGGGLGGNVQTFDGWLTLPMNGTGLLSGFSRFIQVPVTCQTYSAPRTPGDPVQSFDQEFWSLSGQLFGDPDFDQLSINAGSSLVDPSPGHTTLTGQPTGGFTVDSFFDICYEIRFQGAPGSVLDGFRGTTRDCNTFFVGILPVSVPKPEVLASGLQLSAPRPNPLGPSDVATIAFRVPEPASSVSLRVFDMQGRIVRTLPVHLSKGGEGVATWDGTTDRGDRAATGVYVFRLGTSVGSVMQKVILLK